MIHDFSYIMRWWMPIETRLPDITVRLQLYTPWNFHERTPGKFTFQGEADVERFLDIAQDLGLNVLLRVGPYICGEWDFGGFPWWLASSKVRPVQCSPHQTGLDASTLKMWPLMYCCAEDPLSTANAPLTALPWWLASRSVSGPAPDPWHA